MRRFLLFSVICLCLFLCACQTGIEESLAESALVNDNRTASEDLEDNIKEPEEENIFKITSFPSEAPEGQVYHWVLLQNGRRQVQSDEAAVELNKRLAELNIQGSLQIHVVDVTDGLITPQIIEEAKKLVGGQIDFITISPNLIALNKEDWGKLFIDLEQELVEGGLRDFYESVPPRLWEVNRIAGGQYSFANGKEVYQFALLIFNEEVIEKIGLETLSKLQEADGLNNEEVWKEIYEVCGVPIMTGTSSDLSTYSAIDFKEIAWSNENLAWGFSSRFCYQYFDLYTNDVVFNYLSGKFEWFGESEDFLKMKDKVEDYYQKGYFLGLPYWNEEKMSDEDEPRPLARTDIGLLNKAVYSETENVIFMPLWNNYYIRKRADKASYMYSCVMRDAADGWQQILNAIGADEKATKLLGQATVANLCDIIMSAELYRYDMEDPRLGGEEWTPYELVESIYELGIESPVNDFVFNPLPVWKEYQSCNSASSLLRLPHTELKETEIVDPVYGIHRMEKYEIFSLEAIRESWEKYKEIMEEQPIHELVDEYNRQYQSWIGEIE